MPRADPGTVDVQKMLHSRRGRIWSFSVAVTLLMAVMVASHAAELLLLAPSLLLAVALLLRVDEQPNWLLVFLTGTVGVVTLMWSALTGANPAGSMAIGVTFGVLIDASTLRKGLWSVAAVAVIALASTASFATDSPDALGTVLKLTFVAGVWLIAVLDMGSERRIFTLLEESKDAERGLSIAQERHRFAADLHDIQGHTLHVIKLKAAVASKLRTTDPERVAHELHAIQQLAAETIAASRELAEDQHRLSFANELRSCVDLLGAAGVTTTVHRTEGSPAPAHDALAARVLREATTNLLRHSRPRHVTVEVDSNRLTISNDGAPTREGPLELQGLEKLRNRVRAHEGELRIQHAGGAFTLTAHLAETDG